MILTLITALAVLSLLILVHELGHFLSAKKAGMRVDEFGLGYPPRLWGKKIGETTYSLNALPFGGFVRIFGESLEEKTDGKEGAFWAKSKKARTMVIVAGVIANFLLAVLAFSIVYSIMGIPTETNRVTVVGVAPESPAEEAGLEENDLILETEGQEITGLEQFTDLAGEKKGQEMTLLIQRGDQEVEYRLTPRESPPEGEGPLGVVVSSVEMVHYPLWQMPFRGGVEGFKEAFAWTGLVIGGLKQMGTELITRGRVPKEIAGPVGILQITGRVTQGGALAILQFIGILSVNLAVLNILPFPALDGGRLMFVGYEALTRKRPKPEFERWVNTVGMIMILILAVLVTINDLDRVWQTSELAAQLRSAWPF